ncbi:MAG: Mrp/NBP35 family ATP-binding protein [Thermodesulfobacteriota bacterium]|jgi:Mrp family chromosome partitioning ATPase|nr:MAG: Mrp/NBP35 family ATP-binding protein [Thermodesulfobacteriota bacterium]
MSSENCDKTTECNTCTLSKKCSEKEKGVHERTPLETAMSLVKHKFMILSGKGGVGKSSVAVNLAVTLAQEGFEVGIMDADIHGPNIPKMMGVEEKRMAGNQNGLLPIKTPSGVKIISVAFLLHSRDDAVIWRGPLKHSLIKQFLGEVCWGALDYLIVDLPPGTGDEALSTAHLIKNVDGAIIVTTPQDVALLDARKSITFLRQLKVPFIGVIENMSGFTCPHCNKEIDIFKTGGGERAAREMGVSFLGRIPLDPKIVVCSDSGAPFVAQHPDAKAAKAFHLIVKTWRGLLDSTPEKATKGKAT